MGIEPPKGVLLFGPPGTGKTLCARAVANRTDACFIRVIGSELVQKYVGEVNYSILIVFLILESSRKIYFSLLYFLTSNSYIFIINNIVVLGSSNGSRTF